MASPCCPMQRSWHELPADSIAVGAKLKKILHNLTSVVDRRPVEKCYILLQRKGDWFWLWLPIGRFDNFVHLVSLVHIKTRLDDLLHSVESSILCCFHNVKAAGVLLVEKWDLWKIGSACLLHLLFRFWGRRSCVHLATENQWWHADKYGTLQLSQ